MSIDDVYYELEQLNDPNISDMLKYVTIMEHQIIQLERDKRILVTRLIDCGLATKLEKGLKK